MRVGDSGDAHARRGVALPLASPARELTGRSRVGASPKPGRPLMIVIEVLDAREPEEEATMEDALGREAVKGAEWDRSPVAGAVGDILPTRTARQASERSSRVERTGPARADAVPEGGEAPGLSSRRLGSGREGPLVSSRNGRPRPRRAYNSRVADSRWRGVGHNHHHARDRPASVRGAQQRAASRL